MPTALSTCWSGRCWRESGSWRSSARTGFAGWTAARILTINQLSLAALILLYALWKLLVEVAHPGSAIPDLAGQLDSSDLGIAHELTILLYGSLIAAAAVEAGMAWYYHSRGEHLREYLARTPPWIVAMQKAGISV